MENDPKKTFHRVRDVLGRYPMAESTWWNLVREGKAPKPIKLSSRITVWRESDLDAWVESQASNEEGA